MSSYRFFLKDFPSRCAGLLQEYYEDAKTKNKEVTLLISIASSGFVMPFDRLHRNHYNEIKKSVRQERDNLFKRSSFIDSSFFDEGTNSSWGIGTSINTNHSNRVEEWSGLENIGAISHEHKVSEILTILRNALAHGSIFTTNNVASVDKIYFFNREEKTIVKVSPDDFHIFLKKWFNYLEKLDFGTVEENVFSEESIN